MEEISQSTDRNPQNKEAPALSDNEDDSISEHLTSASVENDRSFQEIEIFSQPSALADASFISREENPSLDVVSYESNNGSRNAKSILEEILAQPEFRSNDDEESFNMFADLDLSDKSINIVGNKMKQFEEIVAVKDSTLHALSQDLDSFRDNTYNSSTVSATEYRQLQDECTSKLLEYSSSIIYKNELIHQLNVSLEQSMSERKQLISEAEDFKEQVNQLQQQLKKTVKMVEEHNCSNAVEVETLKNELAEMKAKLKSDQNDYEAETSRLKTLVENLKSSSNDFVDMRAELEGKHAKEVEELRTYFEKKCADLEKNYSEEIFSQHSRKLSGSSSELELSADFLLSNEPGPGGDHNRVFNCKEDVEKMKETLESFRQKLSRHPLEDITMKALTNIENETKKEINQLFNIGEKLEIKAIENKYLEEINNLKYQLDEKLGNISISSAVQEVVNSGDYELTEVVESYERRLQEQIALVKLDCINALETQIERLVANEDDEWPIELLQLRDRFTKKYEQQIEELQEQHRIEIVKTKEEHLRILNGALERAKRRSLLEGESGAEIELITERDNLKKQVLSLRNLLSALVKYLSQAEDELNNTLVETLMKQGLEDENVDNSSGETTNSSRILDSWANKIHITPNFGELFTKLEQQDEAQDITIDLKNELGICLEKLKQEANTILMLTANQTKSPPNTSQIRLRQDLVDAYNVIASLEEEKSLLENRVDELLDKINNLETNLHQTQYRLAQLIEHGQIEVISEGYGDGGHPALLGLEDTTAALSELQEKARAMLVQSRATADPHLLQMIEDLCQVGEKIKEEAKKEARDLIQQIEVADKKYRTTQKFLDEQAVEREEERDEAMKKINLLHEQLKERDKDRANCQMMSSEPGQHRIEPLPVVEVFQAAQLEGNLQELQQRLFNRDERIKELESERDEAVEKIAILRDVIRDLEKSNDSKDIQIDQQLRNLEHLECIVNEQTVDEDNLTASRGDVSDLRTLRQRCEELEEEVQQLRIGAELAGSEGALQQIKLQLFEIEINVDKQTKELEQLHSSNNYSSASEDMSVRDIVRPTSSATMDECEVPLQQLARLKEKLQKHSRAEEAAIKRIQDLEMQLAAIKIKSDELLSEKECLNRQLQEQLVLISDFQIRLDHQRIKAEHIEQQTYTSLEMKIYDLQNDIVSFQEKLKTKDKTIATQEVMLKETQQRLQDLENELTSGKEDELIVDMQKEIDSLRHENRLLKTTSETKILPNLVDNIIQDKNNDIEKLREKLAESERLLHSYTSLNLDTNDLKTLAQLKNSGGSIEQLISILDLSQPIDQMRRYDPGRSNNFTPISMINKEDTEFLEPEISSIERVGFPNYNYTSTTPLSKTNSTELHQKSGEKRVRFDTTPHNNQQFEMLKQELDAKNQLIQEMTTKLKILNEFEAEITQYQNRLDETEKALTLATETFEKEQETAREREQKLGVELAETKMHLSETNKKVEDLLRDSERKDQMYLKLAAEKRELEQRLETNSLELTAQMQNQQEKLLRQLDDAYKKNESYKSKIDDLGRRHEEDQKNEMKLRKQIENKLEKATWELKECHSQITRYLNTIKALQETIAQQELTLKQLQDDNKKNTELITDKNYDIEYLNEDLKHYQDQAIVLEDKIKAAANTEKILQDNQLQISELTKEVARLQELTMKKNQTIAQMNEDQEQLHASLQSIDSKIKETGNILDLSNKLKNEQKKNADLLLEIQQLKASLMTYQAANEVDELTGQVQKELECAAQLDSNILSAVSDQSLSSISEGHDAEVYMKSLSRQKNQNKQLLRNNDRLQKQKLSLEQQCNRLMHQLNEMQTDCDRQKLSNQKIMLEDAKLMEQLRLKLDATLDIQQSLQVALNDEKQTRTILEAQLEELKKPSSSSESTKYKSLPTQDALDLQHLKAAYQTVKEEKEHLLTNNRSLELRKKEMESTVRFTSEMLTLEASRVRAHEEMISVLREKEKSLREELLKKQFELESKTREFEERKIKLDELEQEKVILKKQQSNLIKALKTSTSSLENSLIPENLEQLIRDQLNVKSENKQRQNYIEQLERDKRELERQLREEVQKSMNGHMPLPDIIARCDYLHAKSRKLESVKKALIWQKRFLIDFLESHKKHCLIPVLPNRPHEEHCLRRRHSPINHFRAAVHTVISILRMKFLVRRWHVGLRKYERINSRHYEKTKAKYLEDHPGAAAQFHVGQPISNQVFQHNPFRLSIDQALRPNDGQPISPWSGQTPPSKDRIRTTLGVPLQAPQLLTQMFDRVEQIQETLNLSFSTGNT